MDGHVGVDGAARAAAANGELHRAVGVGDVLLHHHHRLAHHHAVGVACRVGHAVGDHHHAAAQLQVAARPGGGGAGLTARLAGAGAEVEDHLAVPAGLRGQRVPALGGVVQHGDVVDAAVHGAALHAHDVGHGDAGVGGGGGHVGRRGARRVGLEAQVGRRRGVGRHGGGRGRDRGGGVGQAQAAAGGGAAVIELELGGDVAVGVRRAAQAAGVAGRHDAVHHLLHRGGAVERLDLRTRKHRAVARCVGHRQRGGARVERGGGDDVGAIGQARDHTAVGAVGLQAEGAADIAAAHVHAQAVGAAAGRQHDLQGDVAAADHVGAVAGGADLDRVGFVVAVAAGQRERSRGGHAGKNRPTAMAPGGGGVHVLSPACCGYSARWRVQMAHGRVSPAGNTAVARAMLCSRRRCVMRHNPQSPR